MADTDHRRVRLTLFSLEEANDACREIRPELEAMVQAHRELKRVNRAIDVLELANAGATDGNPDARELESQLARQKSLLLKLQHGIQRIERRGCVVKDLEQGLIDFYALDGDRLIFLCWKLGESAVTHWHTLDGGFANRRPFIDRAE